MNKWLTPFGWLTALLFAIVITSTIPSVYIIYPIIFLILGSASSQFSKEDNHNNEYKPRDAKQVFSNGGIATMMALAFYFTKEEHFLIIYIVCFASALSDTWSSDLGKVYGKKPIDILSWKSVKSGISGGITMVGTLFGLLGSSVIAVIYALQSQTYAYTSHIVIFGFLCMLIDSILGSILQAKYKENDTIYEIGNITNLSSGYHFVDNNLVNVLSILITAGLSYLWLQI